MIRAPGAIPLRWGLQRWFPPSKSGGSRKARFSGVFRIPGNTGPEEEIRTSALQKLSVNSALAHRKKVGFP
jgi:hypothetical protein